MKDTRCDTELSFASTCHTFAALQCTVVVTNTDFRENSPHIQVSVPELFGF